MSIHYRQYTDTFSILNYLQNHRLWGKTVKIGILSRKSSKDPSRLAMCNVYFRNELRTGLLARLMPFSIRVTSCPYKLAVIFTCRLCIDIAIQQSTCCIVLWIFRQSIISTIDNSTNWHVCKITKSDLLGAKLWKWVIFTRKLYKVLSPPVALYFFHIKMPKKSSKWGNGKTSNLHCSVWEK